MARKKYRVGIIGRTGKGDYGHGIDTVWKMVPDCEVVAVADENPAGLEAAQKRTDAPKTYADYREMLDKEHPEIVGIGPRWIDQHEELILACVDRGCHIYMEKPFCRTLAEADRIVEAVERKHVKLAIAHQTHYSPIIPVVKKLIEGDGLGTILEIRARGKEDRRGGAEDLWVLGSHMLDLMRVFAGEAIRCSATVRKQSKPVVAGDVYEGNEGLGPLAGDSLNAMYEFDSGIVGYFGSRQNVGGNPARFGIQIFGSKGVVEFLSGYLPSVHYLADPGWSPGRSQANWVPVSSNGVGKPETITMGSNEHGNAVAVKDLIDCIENDQIPGCSIYDGRATVEMILAIFESHRTGKMVEIPLTERSMHPLTRMVQESTPTK